MTRIPLLILFLITMFGCTKQKIKNNCCQDNTATITPEKYINDTMVTYPDSSGLPTIVSEVNIIAPNIFTPDGNGLNDGFCIRGSGFYGVSISIFKRKKMIYFNDDVDIGCWLGKDSDNNEVKEGIYTYKVVLRTIFEELVSVEGEVCLIRDYNKINGCSTCLFADQISDSGEIGLTSEPIICSD